MRGHRHETTGSLFTGINMLKSVRGSFATGELYTMRAELTLNTTPSQRSEALSIA